LGLKKEEEDKMKRWGKVLLVCVMVASLISGCGSGTSNQAQDETSESEGDGSSVKIGVLFPSVTVTRWGMDYAVMEDICKDLGYSIEAQYADESVATQISQMEDMISRGFNVLIITPIDGQAMSATCEKAVSSGIAVISYDRMLRDTDAVTYYATFDNTKVGASCGEYIVNALDLENAEGPFNIEIFTGDIADNNSKMTMEGGMAVLQPYIDSGKLVIKSGQTTLEQCVTSQWSSGPAQTRMENLLSAHYTNARIDAIFSTYGGMSMGVISALKAAGYGTDSKPMPIITAQDAELPFAKSIVAGDLTMSILKDSRVLADIAIGMAEAYASGEDYPINDTTSYNNGAVNLPTYLADLTVFDKNNLDEVLIDSGFFTKEEVYED
jgi:putative multiple sugar transport system substrate-binding protein